MGADIHTWVEARRDGRWAEAHPVFPLSDFDKEYEKPGYRRPIWDNRSYAVFGVLADVRNYSAVPPIAELRDWPEDRDEPRGDDGWDLHHKTYYTLRELLDFDWSKPCEDRRVTVGNNGGCTAPPGGGVMTTYGEHCGEQFTGDLKVLAEWAAAEGYTPDDVRVLIGFDS